MFGAGPFDFQTANGPRVLPDIVPRRSEGLPEMKEAIERRAGQRPPPAALTPDGLAYIVYKFGATGRPKGAQLLHRNTLDGAASNQQVFDAGPGARMLGMARLFHVTGLMSQINLSFSVGGCLILSYRFDQAVMVEPVREHGATHGLGAATKYIAMMNAPRSGPETMASPHVAASGGAPTPPAIIAQAKSFLGTSIQKGYGPTESAIATHASPLGAKTRSTRAAARCRWNRPIPASRRGSEGRTASPRPTARRAR